MKTLITHLQKYYGVYLLITAVLFLILWFPNRVVNRYAISATSNRHSYGVVYIIDTKTGQTWLSYIDGFAKHRTIDFGTPQKPNFKAVISDPNQ